MKKIFLFLNLFEYRGAISPRMKNRRKNKLVKPVGREYRGLLALGSLFLILFVCFLTIGPSPVEAQTTSPIVSEELEETLESTPAAQASESAQPIVERVVEKKPDITEPTPEIKDKLEKHLAEHPLKPLTFTNPLQHTIRFIVKKGIPANTVVLILLFPLVAAVIVGLRHLIGIEGFGIFLPVVLSVVFVATGVFEGLLLFLAIIIVATGARIILRKTKIQYLPRMALLLWFVSLGVLAIFFISPFLNLTTIMTLSIFPILILILLAENFISIHIGMSMKQAVKMTFETLVIALFCSLFLQLEFLQKFVLLYPEIMVIGVAVFDIFVGKYAGLRLLEYKKFKSLLK